MPLNSATTVDSSGRTWGPLRTASLRTCKSTFREQYEQLLAGNHGGMGVVALCPLKTVLGRVGTGL